MFTTVKERKFSKVDVDDMIPPSYFSMFLIVHWVFTAINMKYKICLLPLSTINSGLLDIDKVCSYGIALLVQWYVMVKHY